MKDILPPLRRDLEFFPLQHEGKQYVLIKDHLGLVQEGKAVELPLYQLMTLLDGSRTLRDLQILLMRQQGGMLVGSDEIKRLVDQLDASFLLESDRFTEAMEQIVGQFTALETRPCSFCGHGYPSDPDELRKRLDEIVNSSPPAPDQGKIVALVSPHIDLSVGAKAYGSTYQFLRYTFPGTVVILGIGHHLASGLFSLTEKDFDTPLGTVKTNRELVRKLKDGGGDVFTPNDFSHRSEHSIEFQVLFLQHLLKQNTFTIVPILCGSLLAGLQEYGREAYRRKAGPFLERLEQILSVKGNETLLVAGVDLSHTGPKFGHDQPARSLQNLSEAHDRILLKSLVSVDADTFWEESRRVKDRYNVCGFAALACLLEVLPDSRGQVLRYEIWHEDATRSAVSFASAVFTGKSQDAPLSGIGAEKPRNPSIETRNKVEYQMPN
jgi:MEMO1 family protein